MIAALLVPSGLTLERAALAAGLVAAGFNVSCETSKADLAVIWGGAPPPHRPECPVLVAENAYWTGPLEPYMALAVGGHNGSGRCPARSLGRFWGLGIHFSPWRREGGHVLVCPSRGIGQNPQPADWVARACEILRRNTDRQIKVREHPGNWKTLEEHPDIGLRRDLAGAWACVIWGSAAGIRALVAGIPVIHCAPSWICSAAASDRLEHIEEPFIGDRLEAFSSMASAQWRLTEIASGEAIRALMPIAGLQC